MTLTPPKLHHPLKNSILSLLQTSKTTPQILQIHAHLITTNLISDSFVTSQLLNFIISNTSNITFAELVFTHIKEPSTYMYNTMVKAYVSSSNPRKALHFYVKMRKDDIFGDNYTYPFVVKACGMVGGLWEGRAVLGEVVKRGFEWDMFVRNGLIRMFCRFGEMGWAKELFNGFYCKDLVSWNLMLSGFVGFGDMVEAQRLFDEMLERDVVSWSVMIDGYGKKNGNVIQARALFDRMPLRDLVSWNSMLHAYKKVGDMIAAQQLFDAMQEKNVISWSIMIDGYAQHGNPKEALNLFRKMLCQGVKPDKISVVGAVTACTQLGALDEGRWIHMYMKKNKIKLDVVAQTALVDMYMKCGIISEACKMFNSMLERNVVTWNVMIAGLGMNGFEMAALEYFAQMEMEGIAIDDLIFVSVLTVCSHAGFLTEGLSIFHRMRTHGIEPKLEHYGCLIALLGRAGKLNQAQSVIEAMSMKPNAELWGSLLLACHTYNNVALAEFVLGRLVELKADDCGVYVLMSNIYADARMWEGVLRIRKLMRERNMRKETGKSVIEVDGEIEEFISGKMDHRHGEEIDRVLWSLSKVVLFIE